MSKLTVLDLFTGIGGFSLGLERTGGFETIQFCEIDPFCRKVLAKHWPAVPCHDDITTMEFREGQADVVTGGFPCQDISSAGLKAGITGDRSGLWRELWRAIRDVQPRYAIVENSAALLYRGMGNVLGDLATIGYDAQWYSISAESLGAPHERFRTWIIAYPNDASQPASAKHDETRRVSSLRAIENLQFRQQEMGFHVAGAWRFRQSISWNQVWPNQDSPLGMGVDDGIPQRLDRLRAIGNAVVPQIPELLGNAILDYERCAAA